MKHFTTALLAIALALSGAPVLAQSWPAKPVRLIVGFTPGGGVDINARLLASKLPEILGQSVIVENRPGAGTNIANEHVAKAAPDGYTLLINTAALAINMSLYKKPGFDTLRDFVPVSVFSESPNILVVNSAGPFRSVGELLAAARARPGALNFSSAGSGTTQHLSGELLKLRSGTDIVHVPYKGTAPSLTALIAGEVDFTFANIPSILQHVKSGRLRPLATTGVRRSEFVPELPTMKESGVSGVEVTVWYGVLAPAATPREIVNLLAAAIVNATRAPDIRTRLVEQGAEPVGNTPDEFGKLLREEVARWAEVIGAAKIRAD
ncbi:MAG: tripartite tricarboxylate transporter substrate binding protein [Betaproteobacteria bacterium]|nr:tripartite tricarboxylate transporter substrate binding protein [Betaproteobacteria bacterium]